MSPIIIMVVGPGILAFASGMLGLGVAFAAVPFLAFFSSRSCSPGPTSESTT